MFKIMVLLAPLICFASAKDIKFESCGGNVKKVTVTPCDKEPCEAKKGSKVTIVAEIESNQDSEKLLLWVGATLGTIELPLPGLKRDGCKDRGITCPIKAGEKQTFRFELQVLPFYPTIEVIATFEMTGDSGEKLFCFKAPVKVIAA